MSVRDSRRGAFCWQGVDALELLRTSWDPAESVSKAAGLNVYRALTESANEQRARVAGVGDSDPFETTRKHLARLAGDINVRTVDLAIAEIERLGLVHVEHRKAGEANLPNVYVLVNTPSEIISPPGEQISLGAGQSHEGEEMASPGVARSSRSSSRSTGRREEDPPNPPEGGTPTSPNGSRQRDHARYADELIAFHERLEVTDEAKAIWRAARDKLAADVPESDFNLWIKPVELAGEHDGALYLSAPLPNVSWIERRLRPRLEAAVGDSHGVVVLPHIEKAVA